MVFYLKVNRGNGYVIPNLKHWLDATMLYEDAIVYILCDNPELKERIRLKISVEEGRVSFLESERNDQTMNEILREVCITNQWIRIGQAHLTTHWNADAHGYQFFWNIDADDTFVFLDPLRMVDMFHCVEEYSLRNGVHMNSLDMWRSVSVHEKWETGKHWSLGVVFVDNRVDWKTTLATYSKQVRKARKSILTTEDNLDLYFTYLKDIGAESIETFYFENMKFAHFYDNFLNFSHKSGMCHWESGMINYPIIEHCYGSKFRGKIMIAEDVYKLDIGIEEDEALLQAIAYSKEPWMFAEDVYNEELKIGDLMRRRCELFLKRNDAERIIIWGAGNRFLRYYNLIKKAYNLQFVCDSNSEKWKKNYIDSVECISPERLAEMKEGAFIVVMIDSVAINYKVIHELLNMGITKFEHYENWLSFVMGIEM